MAEDMGTAYGEFGPCLLDPKAREDLEKVLGSGGAKYSVVVLQTEESKG